MMEGDLSVLFLWVCLFGVIVALLRLLYIQPQTGMAYVRTGPGKQKVLLCHGAFVLPALQDVAEISLQTQSLEVALQRSHSLMTKDFLRVDLLLVFSLRVAAREDAVLRVVSVLGGADLNNGRLRAQLKLEAIAVVRHLVASMTLEILHQQRATLASMIGHSLGEQLQRYGLELVSTVLVQLEQTDKAYYNPAHLLDAKGLALLEKTQYETGNQSHCLQRSTELMCRQRDFQTAMQRMEWERQEFVARLQHIRFKAEADAKAEQELEEIEVAKDMALEMLRRDMEMIRLTNQQELLSVRGGISLPLTTGLELQAVLR